MNITISVVENISDQRYDTVGDWQFNTSYDHEFLDIKIVNLNDEKMNACIAIHELIEALLCRFNEPEITTEMVDQFDMSRHVFQADERGLCVICDKPEGYHYDEPGESPEAPYHFQHLHATEIEKYMAARFGINWEDYEKRINSLST